MRGGGDDDVDSKYEDARAFNEYASAAVELGEAHLSNDGILTVIRSTRDIDQGKRRRYLYSVALGKEESSSPSTVALPPVELNDGILARIPSPSGGKVAIFREESSSGSSKRQQVLEVWTDNGLRLSRRILLPAAEHGKPIFDAVTFGGPSWNPSENVLVYPAERNAPETASFFDFPHYDEASWRDSSPSGLADTSVSNGASNRGNNHALGYGKAEKWGEKYNKQSPLLDLFLVNVDTGRVGKVENCPRTDNEEVTTFRSFALGQVQFEPTKGQTIVYTAYDAGGGPEMPRRLGLMYCQQRPSKLYASPVTKLLQQLAGTCEVEEKPDKDEQSADIIKTTKIGQTFEPSEKDGACFCLTLDSRLAHSPVFSPVSNGKSKLVFMSSNNGFDTHSGCFALSSLEWKNGRPVTSSQRTILHAVGNPSDSPAESGIVLGMKFPGVFTNHLPAYGFLSNEYLMINTHWGSTSKIVRVSLSTGGFVLVQHDNENEGNGKLSDEMKSDTLLCIHVEKGVIGTTSSPNQVPIVWHVPTGCFLEDEQKVIIPIQQKTTLASISVPIAASKFSSVKKSPDLDFECNVWLLMNEELPKFKGVEVDGATVQIILLRPVKKKSATEGEQSLPPLIVVPHGGPHSVSLTSFMHSTAFLCGHGGYAVALVNYRGSTGFGQSLVDALPGRIGDLDVKDVFAATMKIKESGLVDPNKLGICGGSYGGFLAAHLTGQYPEMFRAAVMRNPVVNLTSMVTATDIPDWVFVEGLGGYDWSTYRPPMNKEEVSIMWSKSPIRHVAYVQTPTLIALGMQDLRVPPSQGLEWYHTLRARRSIPTKLLVYEDNDHAILGAIAEADLWVNIKRWFDEHL